MKSSLIADDNYLQNMGVLFQKLEQSNYTHAYQARIFGAIEADVCRRRGVGLDSPALKNAVMTHRDIAGRARFNGLDVLYITMPDGASYNYCVKPVHGSFEAEASQIASQAGLGPRVLEVFEERREAIVLEEYFDHRDLLRERGFAGFANPAKTLADVFCRFMVPKRGLLQHNDIKFEHVFAVGSSNPQIYFIDWGKARLMPVDSFLEWAQGKYSSFYNEFFFNDPFLWHDFVGALVERSDDYPINDQLNVQPLLKVAFMRFFCQYASLYGINSWLAEKFIRNNASASPFGIDVGPVADYLDTVKRVQVKAPAFQFLSWVREHEGEIKAWESMVLAGKH